MDYCTYGQFLENQNGFLIKITFWAKFQDLKIEIVIFKYFDNDQPFIVLIYLRLHCLNIIFSNFSNIFVTSMRFLVDRIKHLLQE